ncbi:MAG TPA: hypothetical protein VLU92_00845 [Candidatus Dormibacteraeota bacterium]|nr:hypothetical protein [Candidatus Dormibacteraeota bacterium]
MTRPRRIVGFGGAFGGGFGGSGPGSRLDEYVLELTGPDRPKVLFLPTPVADADPNIVTFYERFAGPAQPAHLKLFGAPDAARWQPLLVDQDVIVRVPAGLRRRRRGRPVLRGHGSEGGRYRRRRAPGLPPRARRGRAARGRGARLLT